MGSQRTGHDGTTTARAPTLLLETRSLLNRPGVVLAFSQFLAGPKIYSNKLTGSFPWNQGHFTLLMLQSLLPTAAGGSLCSLVQPPHAPAWCSCFWLEFLHILGYWDVTRKLFFSNLVHLFVYAGSLLLHSSFLQLLRVGSTLYFWRRQ